MSAQVDVLKPMRVAEAYCYDAGAPNAAKNLRAAVAALLAERDALVQEVDRLQADGVHSCNVHCQRTACVLRRERDALREALRYAIKQVPELATVPGIATALALTTGASA